MQLFVLIISLYLGALRDEVKEMDGLVMVLFFLKGKLNRNYFENWLEKVITGSLEKIIISFTVTGADRCSVQNTAAAYGFLQRGFLVWV